MHIQHKKNTAYYLSFPMVDDTTPAAFRSGVSPADTAYYKDGAGAWTSLAITDTASEIASTGVYEIDLTAAELNHDQVIIKFSVSGAADTAFLFDMRTELAEDLGNGSGAVTVATNNDKTGYSISGTKTTLDALNDVSTADVNAQCDTALADYDGPTNAEMTSAFTEIKGATWASGTDTLEQIRDNCATAVGFSTHSAADVWTAGSRTLTAATNITSDASAITMSSAGVVGTVNLVNTTTTNTDMRGTDSALLAASAPTNFGDLAITVTTGLVSVGTNNDKTGYSISGTKTTLDALNDVSTGDVNAQVLDVVNVDALVAGQSMTEALRRCGALTSGTISGAGTGTETFTDWAASGSTIVVTVDGSGNRSGVTFN